MNRIVHIAVCLIFVAGASCSESSPPPPPPSNPLVLDPMEAAEISLPEPTTADLLYGVRNSELVVVAEVLRLEPVVDPFAAPCTQQGVTYRVVEAMHGTAPAETVRVAHPVCLGRPFIDNRAFGLSRAYFTPGRTMVLFLRRDDTGRVRYEGGEWVSDYWVWDERYGVLLDSEELRALVRKTNAAGGGAGGSGATDPFGGRRKR
ncbi:MAG: hypothetical protein IPF82_02975 [Blastocatellia bacterium]|nr:hypothetical protein [Blastocatellia bacterium]